MKQRTTCILLCLTIAYSTVTLAHTDIANLTTELVFQLTSYDCDAFTNTLEQFEQVAPIDAYYSTLEELHRIALKMQTEKKILIKTKHNNRLARAFHICSGLISGFFSLIGLQKLYDFELVQNISDCYDPQHQNNPIQILPNGVTNIQITKETRTESLESNLPQQSAHALRQRACENLLSAGLSATIVLMILHQGLRALHTGITADTVQDRQDLKALKSMIKAIEHASQASATRCAQNSDRLL